MFKMLPITYEIILWIYLIYLSYKDIKFKLISILDIGIGVFISCSTFVFIEKNYIQVLIGLFIGGLFVAISIIAKQAIGLGDALIILILGIIKGVDVINILMLALFLFIIFVILLSLYKKNLIKNEIPFIPFICCGEIIGVVYEML